MKTHGSKCSQAGFSLVEIVLVIGVLAVSFLPLIALMPAGQQNFRSAINLTVCAQIAQRVVNDASQANFDTLVDGPSLRKLKPRSGFTFRAPTIRESRLRYFDDQGSEVVATGEDGTLTPDEMNLAVYQVSVRVMPQARLPASDQADSASQIPSLAQVTVQVAAVPPTVPLHFSPAAADDVNSPDRNLIAKQPGIEVYTYSAFIGRAL